MSPAVGLAAGHIGVVAVHVHWSMLLPARAQLQLPPA
jgi:hypothetical protein